MSHFKQGCEFNYMNKKEPFGKVDMMYIHVSSNIICVVLLYIIRQYQHLYLSVETRGDDVPPGYPRPPLQTFTFFTVSQTVILLIVKE